MPQYRYTGKKLSEEGVIEAFKAYRYYLKGDNPKVYRTKGTRVKEFDALDDSGNKTGYLYVRIYSNGLGRTIGIHRLCWMVTTGHTIPPGWEIHHRDLNPSNNAFDNLYCLHPLDHKKLHRGLILEDTSFNPETF